MDRFQQNLSDPCMVITSNSSTSVDTLDYIDDILRDLTSYKRAFISRGMNMIDFINSKARMRSFHLREPTTPDIVQRLEGDLCKIINGKQDVADLCMAKSVKDNRIPLKHSGIELIEDYRGEDLNSVERFIREYETKLDEYNETTEGVVNKTEHVSEKHDSVLAGAVNDELVQTCKVFKVKLDEYKNNKNPPTSTESYVTLINQLDNIINLSKKVEEIGKTSVSMNKFIKNCQDFRKRLLLRHNIQKKVKTDNNMAAELVCHYSTDDNDLDNLSDVMCNLCCGRNEPPTQEIENKLKDIREDMCDRSLFQHSSTNELGHSSQNSSDGFCFKQNKPLNGLYRTVGTITKVTRYLNPDGTIQEEREVLKIKQARSDYKQKKAAYKKPIKDRHESSNHGAGFKRRGLKKKHGWCDLCGEGIKHKTMSTTDAMNSICHSADKHTPKEPMKSVSKGKQLCIKHKNIIAPKTLRNIYLSKSKSSVVSDCTDKDDTCEICAVETLGKIYLTESPKRFTCSDTAKNTAINQNEKNADICGQSSKSSKCEFQSSPALSCHLNREQSDVDKILSEQCCGENIQAQTSRSQGHADFSSASQCIAKSISIVSCDMCKEELLPRICSETRCIAKSLSNISCDMYKEELLPRICSETRCISKTVSKTSCDPNPSKKVDWFNLLKKYGGVKLSERYYEQKPNKLDEDDCCDKTFYELCSKHGENPNEHNCACTDQKDCVNKVLCDLCLTKVIIEKIEKLLTGKLPKCPHYSHPRQCQCCVCSEDKRDTKKDWEKCNFCNSTRRSSQKSVILRPEPIYSKKSTDNVKPTKKYRNVSKKLFCPKSNMRVNLEGEECLCEQKDADNICKACKTKSNKDGRSNDQNVPELLFCPKSCVTLNLKEVCMCKDKDGNNICKPCNTKSNAVQCECPPLTPRDVVPHTPPQSQPKAKTEAKLDECNDPCTCPSDANVENESNELKSVILDEDPEAKSSDPLIAQSTNDFGLFKSKTRVITRLSRFLKSDGTIQEKREVITMKDEKHVPDITEIENNFDKLYFEDNSEYEVINDSAGVERIEAEELTKLIIPKDSLLSLNSLSKKKKSNVLGKVIIPRTQVTIRYILDELEELEREEFFRLKKILEVKYRHKKKNQQSEPAVFIEEESPYPPAPPPLPPELKKLPPKEEKLPPPKVEKPLPPKEEKPIIPPSPPCPVCIEEEVEQFCILCEGPMHPEGERRKLTEEQRQQESATIAELKEKLGKVVSVTAEYEKKVGVKDSVSEFKQNTETLRRTLRAPPAFIPDNIDVTKLCDICKEIYDEQVVRSKCIVCGEPTAVKDIKMLAVAKESKRKLQEGLDTLLGIIKEYERQGLQDEKIKEYKITAAEWKNKLIGPPIPKDVDVTRLCSNCKERMQATPTPSKVSFKESSIASMEPTVASNASSSEQQSSDLLLGVFETEEITEIIQVRNPDGTITEKRRIITIKRSEAPSSPGTSSFKDKKSVGHVAVHHRKSLMERLPRDVHSEYAITPLPMADRMIKTCISSDTGYNDEVLERITEFTRPGIQTSHGLQTDAGVGLVKSLISSASSPFGDLEEDDDSSDYKTPEENLLPPNPPK